MYGTFTLTGRHTTPSGKAHAGQVVITPNVTIRDVEGDVVMSGAERVSLDETGAWSIVLPCDSPGLNPSEGIGYRIGYALHSVSSLPQSFYATADLAGSTLDVSDIVTVSVPAPLSAIVGPKGEPGPAGADGARGPAGPKGDPGTPADPEAISRRVGVGGYTSGDVIEIGAHAYANRADVGTSIVAGGAPNYENVVGGNLANVDTGTSNLAGAPTLSNENGNWNFLLGGYDTVVNGWANSIVGFHCKVDVDANHGTVGGGSRHFLQAGSSYGTVAGGTGNVVGGASATVSGGTTNTATGNNSTVSGGNNNKATASAATISGGSTNTASGGNSTAVGGNSNTATGNSATVVGGLTNTANGANSVVVGGRSNTAGSDYSSARGYGAVTTNFGEDAYASNWFATPGDAQASRMVLFRQTSDATASDLRVSNSSPPLCPEQTTWVVVAHVVARRADADGENAAWEVKGLYKRDTGNTGAWVGTPTITSLGANAGNAWTLTAGSFSVGNVRLVVTGEVGKTIRWVSNFTFTQVSG